MFYKAGYADFSICGTCCKKSFARIGPDAATAFHRRTKFVIVIFLVIIIGVTFTDSLFEHNYY